MTPNQLELALGLQDRSSIDIDRQRSADGVDVDLWASREEPLRSLGGT